VKRVNGGGCIKGFPREVTSVGRSFYQQSEQARPSIHDPIDPSTMHGGLHRACRAGPTTSQPPSTRGWPGPPLLFLRTLAGKDLTSIPSSTPHAFSSDRVCCSAARPPIPPLLFSSLLMIEADNCMHASISCIGMFPKWPN
jgi:hypothetical protein